ncbi:MAG: amidohydrolase family protein [Proteobacteria bacterium]|nr:amidohydrolase family protein [Pseudomonadota bacterium]MBU1717221.1 amidohydrolase family protein [Pseudomonadota bacterium]
MGETRLILAGSLIDGSGDELRRNVFLTVQDTLITAIGSAAELSRHVGAVIDDFSHCTIVPALIDCSVSLAQSPSVDRQVRSAAADADPIKKAVMVTRHIHYCHAYGVLGVAVDDDLPALPDRAQERISLGNIIEIRSSGGLYRSSPDWTNDNPVSGDFLKIGYSGNIEDEVPKSSRLNHEELGRILQNRGARKAVVLANGPRQVAEALAAGCDAIEQGFGMGEDNLRKMAEQNVLWIPSVLRAKNSLDGAGSGGDVACRFSQRYVAPGKPNPVTAAFWQKTLTEQLGQLRLARKLGVTTAVGTGAGSAGILHGESMVEEMKLFIRAGYSLAETIRCASENGARFFGLEKLGTLAVGRSATFLIARGTAQQLPRKLSYLEGIYVGGIPSSIYHKNPTRTA